MIPSFNYIILKKSSLLCVFLYTFLINSFSQHTIIPTGSTTHLREVRKVDNVVTINGIYNFFAKCYNDCEELVVLEAPGPTNYFNRHINLVDTNHFYVSSFLSSNPYHAIVSKTVNGGQSWSTMLDTISGEFFAAGLLAFDANRLVFCSSQGRTFTSNDEGETWEVGPQNGTPIISGLLRVNDSTAILGVEERLRVTTDKGQTWLSSGFIQANPYGFQSKTLDSIYIVSSGPSGSYFSYIFGQPFTSVDKIIPMFDPIGLFAFSKDEIYVTGKGWPQENGRIMKTTDLGETWSYYDVPETEKLLEMVFLNDSIALIGGYDGVLVKWNKNSPMTEWGVGLNENQLVAFASVKPNPATEQQQLEISTVPGETVEVEIVDLQGRKHGLVYSGTSESSSLLVSIDVSQLSSGTYMYSLIAGDRKGHVRFVKQ